MISAELKKKYLPTIGIECHVQLKTKTKMFSAVPNDAREAEPNTLISHIDLGMPGALPVLNEKAVALAIRAAFALHTEPQHFSKFDRKHYFYPDLPKGYQITQFDQPIILGGYVDITIHGEQKRIGITRAHLEEDAGKSTHPAGADYSLVDLNRAGTPLLEIVSEPDMHSAEEAKAYAKELYLLMKYADVSDANLYYGNMRFDVNISVSKDPNALGTRAEIKNINSFRAVEKAVEYEIDRQIELLEKGETIVQETRGWDDAKQKTLSQRSKEEAHDYRYFPDPDLPPIEISPETIEQTRADMPILPQEIRGYMIEAGLDRAVAETIIDNPSLARHWNNLRNLPGVNMEALKRIGDWFGNEVVRQLTENPNIDLEASLKADNTVLSGEQLVRLSAMVDDNKLSSTAAKAIIAAYWTNLYDVEAIAKEMDLLQVSDAAEIEKIVDEVIATNATAASDVRNGEMKAIGFLVGQVMKLSQGKANPPMVQELLRKKLS